MYLCLTHIDAQTHLPCTEAPMRAGPTYPAVKGFRYAWANESQWPVACRPDGAYVCAPLFYGTCDDDADTSLTGVIEVMTEAEFRQRQRDEFYARQPFPSWLFDEATLAWQPPVPYPADGKPYRWDEDTQAWVEIDLGGAE